MNNNPKIWAAALSEIPNPISIGFGISETPRLKFLNSLFESYLNLV
jgi:hypothetical protein